GGDAGASDVRANPESDLGFYAQIDSFANGDLGAADVLSGEKETAGRLLHPHDGLAGWARGAELPANRPLPAPIEFGPQCILDCVGVLKREIAICLCEWRQLTAAGPSVDQTFDGDLGGDGHEKIASPSPVNSTRSPLCCQ